MQHVEIAEEGSAAPEGAIPSEPVAQRRRVVSWALWDWGSAAFNAVITTFVFTVWLTSDAFVDPAITAAATADCIIAGASSGRNTACGPAKGCSS